MRVDFFEEEGEVRAAREERVVGLGGFRAWRGERGKGREREGKGGEREGGREKGEERGGEGGR